MDLDTENALIWGGEMMTFDVYTADLEVRWRARRMAPPQNSIKVPGIPVGLKKTVNYLSIMIDVALWNN